MDSRVIELQKMTPLEIPIKKEYFPGFRVSVIAMYENNVSAEASRDFLVEDEGKTLQVGLECPAEIKPASKAAAEDPGARLRTKWGPRRNFSFTPWTRAISPCKDYRTPDLLRPFYYYAPLGRNSHPDLLFEELHANGPSNAP